MWLVWMVLDHLPALLPDGSISELSLNRVLVAREQVTPPTRYTEIEEHESLVEAESTESLGRTASEGTLEGRQQ